MKTRERIGSKAEEARVLVLSHCILNQATRWRQGRKAEQKNQGPVTPLLRLLSAQKIGAVQLPCPEFTFCGNPRPPRTREEYESMPGFRSYCERLAKDSAQHLKTLTTMSINPRIRILAIVGVERSPTCGVKCTPRMVDGATRYVEEKGLFLEILEKKARNLGLDIPVVGLDLDRPADFRQKLGEMSSQASRR